MSEGRGGADRTDRHEARAAARAARHEGRTTERSARHETRVAERAADDLPAGYAVLWPEPPAAGRRGPRPGLSVAEIVDAAVRLADAEGAGAVSMARVADEVGVTTMALYRYVGGKDELVAAMYDAAVGRPPVQDAGTPWRPALEAWCRAQLTRAVRHPWLGAVVPPAAVGPNRLAWIEAGLQAVAGTPLAPAQRAAVVGRLSLHLLGEMQLIAAMMPRAGGHAGEPGRRTEGAEHPATLDYRTVLTRFADPATHPATVAALEAGAFDDDPAEDMRDFGLELLLDGVAALVARASAR